MDVYVLDADANRFQNLILAREEDRRRLIGAFDGTPMAGTWTPPRVEVLAEEDGAARPPGDFPSLGGYAPVFSRRATDAVEDLLEDAGELLPLDSPDGTYLVFNVTRVLDALDEDRSDVRRFKSTGRIMNIDRYQLIPERIGDAPIFKLSQIPRMYTFVTDRFVHRVRDAGLAGFLFDRKVWSDSGE
ncbi:MAG: imm11 family protein [Actinomycetota bacterium]